MRNNEHRSWKRFAACLTALSLLLLLPVFGQAEEVPTIPHERLEAYGFEPLTYAYVMQKLESVGANDASKGYVCCEPNVTKVYITRIDHFAVGAICDEFETRSVWCSECEYRYSLTETWVGRHHISDPGCPN